VGWSAAPADSDCREDDRVAMTTYEATLPGLAEAATTAVPGSALALSPAAPLRLIGP
jgi:hypothetical protein